MLSQARIGARVRDARTAGVRAVFERRCWPSAVPPRRPLECKAPALHASSTGGEDFGNAITPDGIIGPDGEVIKRARNTLSEEQKALWKRAIKLPMYSVGLVPVLVSATAAFVHFGSFNPLKTLGLCVAAVAIIAWLNLSNDVFDAATGVDKNKTESVVNLVGNWRKVFLVANVFLVAGAALLFGIVSAVPNELATKALYAAICCGYLYQGPPFRWSYLGLGEPLCFLAFGPLATNAFYLAQIPASQAVPRLARPCGA